MATTTLKQLRENAADALNLFLSAEVTSASGGTSLTIPKLAAHLPGADRVRDAYVTKNGQTYARVISVLSNSIVTINTSIGIVNGDTVGIYFLMDPESMTAAGNEELEKIFHEHRLSVPLVPTSNVYDISTYAERRGDILEVSFRDSSGSFVRESAAPGFTIEENNDGVSIRLLYPPPDGLTMVVRMRRRYVKLVNETDVTTCPYPLALLAFQWGIIRRLQRKFGSDFVKSLLAEEMRYVKHDFDKAKFEHEPALEAIELTQNWEWSGPDIPPALRRPSW